MAWTADDGTDAAVIRAYADFARRTGHRFTLFVTASYGPWTETAEVLRPLVASGQIQLANHTWDHPDLTSLSDDAIRSQLQRAHDFIQTTFGVDARPYFRPPYGYINGRVERVAAEMGYTVPTMWYGSIADSSYIPQEEIVRLAGEWFLPARIVIAHLNFDPVVGVMDQLDGVLRQRGLQTATLNDVFVNPFSG
jgi:peptidoglycan/xylan/chitin deacetylase (PgdA/CDA1 family)